MDSDPEQKQEDVQDPVAEGAESTTEQATETANDEGAAEDEGLNSSSE